MTLARLDISDLYFTPQNSILLRSYNNLIPLEQVVDPGDVEPLKKIMRADARKEVDAEADPVQACIRIQQDLIEDCRALYKKLTEIREVDSALLHEGFSHRINRVETATGTNFSIRRVESRVPPLKGLGLPAQILDPLVLLGRQAGLILLAGATGAGKTTTASSLLCDYLDRYGEFAYTIEDPPEFLLAGPHTGEEHEGYCIQTNPGTKENGWAEGVKSALRSRPRYILVGEVRDPNCASEMLRAANSGHLVLTTIHAQSIQDALSAVVKYATPVLSESLARNQLSNGLLACLHQNIVNRALKASFVFAGPRESGVRMKISQDKMGMLETDIERQAIRAERGMPLFD